MSYEKHVIHVFVSLVLLLIALTIISRGNTANATELQETTVIGEEKQWTHYDEFSRIYDQTATEDIMVMHNKICKTTSKSPLCEDIEILRRIDTIAREKGVPIGLMIGISYAESHIGTAFNREACRGYHNWAGLKGRKHDNGKTEWFTKNGKADGNGCWLYKFDSIEQGFYSLANTISMGYASCKNNVRCISGRFVGNANVQEQSWINNVAKFYE